MEKGEAIKEQMGKREKCKPVFFSLKKSAFDELYALFPTPCLNEQTRGFGGAPGKANCLAEQDITTLQARIRFKK